jgi:hypothetical protein
MDEYKRPSKSEIDSLKKKHGEIFLIAVDDKECLLRKPTMRDIEAAMAVRTKKGNPIEFSKTIVQNCWITGHEVMRTNDDLYLAVCQKVDELVEIKEASIAKL